METGMEPSTLNLLTPNDLRRCDGHIVALDVETTGLHWWEHKLVGVGVWSPNAGVRGWIPPVHTAGVAEVIAGWGSETTILMHNAKFDLHFLGLTPLTPLGELRWRLLDTMVMVHLFDSRLRKGLAEAEKTFLGTATKEGYQQQAPARTPIAEWPLEILLPYCVNDARVTYELAATLVPEIQRLGLWELLLKDMNYLGVLWETERRGFQIYVPHIQFALETYTRAIEGYIAQLREATGLPELNWRSTRQMAHALYEQIGVPRPVNPFADADGVDRSRFALKGMYNSSCTSSIILVEKVKHPLALLVVNLREADRIIKTITNWMRLRDSSDVLHTSFNQTGTRTGRLSSTEPNFQNIPGEFRSRFQVFASQLGINQAEAGTGKLSDVELIHRDANLNLRNAFRARPGFSTLSIDFKRMEMVMFGIAAQEPFMLEQLRKGADIHSEIAKKVWGSGDEVRREWAKTITFGLIYGMTIGSLQHRLSKTHEEAERLARDYWATFPRVQPWLREVVMECRRNGMLRYWSGRIWREENPMDMYKGANALIQGGCADLLSIAALRCVRWLKRNYPEAGILNLIHDELLFEIPTGAVREIVPQLSKIMEVEDLLQMPFYNDPKVGSTYGDTVSLKEFLAKMEDPNASRNA